MESTSSPSSSPVPSLLSLRSSDDDGAASHHQHHPRDGARSVPDGSRWHHWFPGVGSGVGVGAGVDGGLTLSELSGACGDFGTLIPLLVAMARQRTVYLAPTLFLSGLVHVATGWYWDLPMPLQPMKAIASLAIAQGLSRVQVTIAGVGMGACFLVLSVGNLIEVLHRWIPQSVIGGLQLGVGWKLALKGIQMIQGLPWWFSSSSVDCITLAILSSALCLYGLRRNKSPAGSAGSRVHGPRTTRHGGEIAEREEEDIVDADDEDPRVDSQGLITRDDDVSQSMCQNIVDRPPVGIVLFVLGIALAAVQLQLTGNSNGNSNDSHYVSQPESLIVNALRNSTATD
jgi:Molybdate transporter of MFS superfamily